jgi:hypothetical protein
MSVPARQFWVFPKASSQLPGSNATITIGNYILGVSEGVEIAHIKGHRRTITLLGDAIDLTTANRPLQRIAETLLGQGTLAAVWQSSRTLCGRWVLLLQDAGMLTLFTDAGGLFPVYFVRNDGFFASSSPRLLASHLSLPFTAEGADFMARPRHMMPTTFHRPEFQPPSVNTWWPLDSTPYRGMRHLVPNHAVCDSCEGTRLWPLTDQNPVSVPVAAEQVARYLVRAIQGIAQHYPDLRLPLTAGLDSRVLLAAAYAADVQMRCYTYAPADYDSLGQDFHVDMALAQSLAKGLGVQHDVVTMPTSASPTTLDRMTSNIDSCIPSTTLPREHEALVSYVGDAKGVVCLNGNLSEIGRGYYGTLPQWALSAGTLSMLTKMYDSPLALATYASWLAERRSFVRTSYNPLDLLYWEDRMGSWQSTVQQQMNQFWSIFTPYNSHALLTAMLSAPAWARSSGALHRAIIKHLLPQALSYPINPVAGSLPSRTLSKGKAAIKKAARQSPYTNLIWFVTRNRLLRR